VLSFFSSRHWDSPTSSPAGDRGGGGGEGGTLYQERAVFGKMKMDPGKWAQTQNAGEVSSLQWFFSQSVELMTDEVWLHCIRPMLLK
jgi:hypothetical protein